MSCFRIQAYGGRRFTLKAKLAGGSQMFQFNSSNEIMRIGPRNVEAVLQQLEKFKFECWVQM